MKGVGIRDRSERGDLLSLSSTLHTIPTTYRKKKFFAERFFFKFIYFLYSILPHLIMYTPSGLQHARYGHFQLRTLSYPLLAAHTLSGCVHEIIDPDTRIAILSTRFVVT